MFILRLEKIEVHDKGAKIFFHQCEIKIRKTEKRLKMINKSILILISFLFFSN